MNITNSLQFRNSKASSHHICHDGTILLPTSVEYSRWHRIVNYGKNFTLDDCSNLSLCVFAAVMLLGVFMSDIAPAKKKSANQCIRASRETYFP